MNQDIIPDPFELLDDASRHLECGAYEDAMTQDYLRMLRRSIIKMVRDMTDEIPDDECT